MPPPQTVASWLNQHFPQPQVDPEWLNDCCEWLTHDQGISPVTAFPQFVAELKSQLLQSDLKDSMLHGTGLEPGITTATRPLRGAPVLVQVVAITEIGTSAFQLEQTRAAREERMKAGEGNVEGDEEGDVEVEGEGPMPKYPRGTLRFQLSDGATVFDAMEYRPLPALTLGNTPLGFKMQLKGTHFQNGMAFLEPKTVDLLGEQTADLDEHRERDFKRGLRVRLGRPLSPEPPENGHGSLVEMRSPLREISPPLVPDYPQHDDDINMEPRRRLPAGSSVAQTSPRSAAIEDKGARPIHNLPSRSSAINHSASQSSKTSTTSSYFNTKTTNSGATSSKSGRSKEERDKAIALALQSIDCPPTTRQLVPSTASSSQRSATLVNDAPHDHEDQRDPSFDFDLLDQFENDENEPPASSSSLAKGKGSSSLQPAFESASTKNVCEERGGSPDYFMSDDDRLDPAVWDKLDEMETAGSGMPQNTAKTPDPSHNGAAAGGTGPSSGVRRAGALSKQRSVIEIEDSDEDKGEEMLEADDKENEPVQARSVRRRVDRDVDEVEILGPPVPMSQRIGSQRTASQRTASQRTGRPAARSQNPVDVISLSDSD